MMVYICDFKIIIVRFDFIYKKLADIVFEELIHKYYIKKDEDCILWFYHHSISELLSDIGINFQQYNLSEWIITDIGGQLWLKPLWTTNHIAEDMLKHELGIGINNET